MYIITYAQTQADGIDCGVFNIAATKKDARVAADNIRYDLELDGYMLVKENDFFMQFALETHLGEKYFSIKITEI